MNHDLSQGKVSSVLLRYTLPLFISTAFQQLYNIADSAIAGRFAGEAALAAIGAEKNSFRLGHNLSPVFVDGIQYSIICRFLQV